MFQGTKVRRKEPLPEIDLPITSIRTLLYKLSEELESLTVDKVCCCLELNLFSVRVSKEGFDLDDLFLN